MWWLHDYDSPQRGHEICTTVFVLYKRSKYSKYVNEVIAALKAINEEKIKRGLPPGIAIEQRAIRNSDHYERIIQYFFARNAINTRVIILGAKTLSYDKEYREFYYLLESDDKRILPLYTELTDRFEEPFNKFEAPYSPCTKGTIEDWLAK